MTRRLFALSLLALVLVPGLSVPAFAASKTPAATPKEDISQAITTSYSGDSSIQVGIIVKLKDKTVGTVEPLQEADAEKMLGVVVAPDAAAVTLTPETGNKQQIFVATSGRYDVLVSNQNGIINPGDLVTISAVTGIGMKADENQAQTLGKAVSGFTGTQNVISKVTLKDSLGHQTTAAIGRITIDISIMHNPLQQKATDFLPAFLAHAATTVASKRVSAARVYLGLAILMVSGFVTANIVYSGVRSGMIAVGRNPLSKKSIIKSLFQAIAGGLIVFIAGIFAVYLILKL
ncbi:MAG: rane protein of unknown function [Candidatus Saccharibacteria bacterium]|nr:rane protein of unknown function [Candidatus Saccharibacteria bacterium]